MSRIVALSLRRQGGGPRQRRKRLALRLLLVLGVASITLLLCDSAGLLTSEPQRALYLAACSGAAAWCLLWLVADLWSGLSQAASALALPEKRAGWVHLDDLLALSALRPQEMLVGFLLGPWHSLLRASAAFGLLILCCLLPALESIYSLGLGRSDHLLKTVLLLPLTLALLGVGSMLATLSTVLYFALMNRGLAASRLLPFAGASTLLASLAWLPMSIFYYGEGCRQFDVYAAPAWADLGNLLGGLLLAVLTIALLCWAARLKALRTFAALLGLPAFAALHLLVWMLLGAAEFAGLPASEFSEPLGLLMLAMFRGWGLGALLNPALLPSGLCLGLEPRDGAEAMYGWGGGPGQLVTACWPLAYLAAGLLLLLLLARFAVLAVETRRRGEA